MTYSRPQKKINLALQGGGSHGAFTWGVIDGLLEDGRIEIEGFSGTSAGSMNAVVFAYGNIQGPEAARQALHDFWKAISKAGQMFNPIHLMPWEKIFGRHLENSITNIWFEVLIHSFSPYQLNPWNFNPLKDILMKSVDFAELRDKSKTKLWITATNVNSGKARVFSLPEVSADVVMASACMPNLFQAVKINDNYYWDGGYMGNPVLYPLIYHTDSRDIVIVHINPIQRPGPPTSSEQISNRIHEISFNTALIKELRAIYFIKDLQDKGWIKEEFREQMKTVLMHSIRSDDALADLSVTSKLDSDWNFLNLLKNRGRACAKSWLEHNFDKLNETSSVDLFKEFL